MDVTVGTDLLGICGIIVSLFLLFFPAQKTIRKTVERVIEITGRLAGIYPVYRSEGR